jgi:hypothetical protein
MQGRHAYHFFHRVLNAGCTCLSLVASLSATCAAHVLGLHVQRLFSMKESCAFSRARSHRARVN